MNPWRRLRYCRRRVLTCGRSPKLLPSPPWRLLMRPRFRLNPWLRHRPRRRPRLSARHPSGAPPCCASSRCSAQPASSTSADAYGKCRQDAPADERSADGADASGEGEPCPRDRDQGADARRLGNRPPPPPPRALPRPPLRRRLRRARCPVASASSSGLGGSANARPPWLSEDEAHGHDGDHPTTTAPSATTGAVLATAPGVQSPRPDETDMRIPF